jgi:hypothetical protein
MDAAVARHEWWKGLARNYCGGRATEEQIDAERKRETKRQ